jgi:hypothetical protein
MRLGIQGPTAESNARISVPRAIGVTLGLFVTGTTIGACLGAGLLAALSLAVDGSGGYPYVWDAFYVAGFLGGVIGAIALPFTTWALPRVSIGKIIATTAAGTSIGAASFFSWAEMNAVAGMLGAVIGFSCAAGYLGIRSSSLWDRHG